MPGKIIVLKLFVFISMLFVSCVSIDRFNAEINTKRNEKDLQKDIDFVHHKLESLHPDLYHYISKKDLDYKFDSLKTSLTTPMTSNEFYFRLSPVVASIKQGHTQTIPLVKKMKYHDRKSAGSKGLSPLAHFDFELFDNKLYIVKNNSKDTTIKAGTELQMVDGIKPIDVITRYRTTFTSDGSNQTFFSRKLAKGFARYFYYEHGILDSVNCQLKYKDTLRNLTLLRIEKPVKSVVDKTKEQKALDRELKQKEEKKKRLLGYDTLKRIYSKELTFPVQDSSVAIMKINDFMKGNYRKFYKQSFQQLNSAHTKTLVLDLRDNGGGHIRDIYTLYSYLADSSFHLIEKPQVTSKTSLWHIGYYNDQPFWVQVIQTILLPFVVEMDIITYLKTKKEKDHTYTFALRESRLARVKSDGFRGKVYVLINGGSFSASSLLSSNLKGSKRAIFVGNETGGAYNGCVAGILPVRTLPASKLKLRFGLMVCKTPYSDVPDGRGILPDMEITPTIADRINGKDPELDWVLNDIKSVK